MWSLRDSLVIKNTDCSCRRLSFDSQHPQGNSQPFVTLVPENLMHGCGGVQPHTYAHIYTENKITILKINNKYTYVVSDKYRNPLYISYYFSLPGLRFCLLKKKKIYFCMRGEGVLPSCLSVCGLGQGTKL